MFIRWHLCLHVQLHITFVLLPSGSYIDEKSQNF